MFFNCSEKWLYKMTKRKKTFWKLIFVFFSLIMVASYLRFVQETRIKTRNIFNALGSMNVSEMVKPFVETSLISPSQWPLPQKNLKSHRSILGVVLVTSKAENIDRRNTIRRSWGNRKNQFKLLVLFFTGRPASGDMTAINSEAQQFDDLIVDNFPESYYSLSVKTLRMFKWSLLHVPSAKFFVKTDDDVFVNLRNLNDHLNSKSVSPMYPTYIGGVIHADRVPHTVNSFSKWYVPPMLWSHVKKFIHWRETPKRLSDDAYPPYAEGNFYIISYPLLPKLLNASLAIPLFHLEDVYVTGIVASHVPNVHKIDVPYVFSSSSSWPWFSSVISGLMVSPEEVLAYHCDNYIEFIEWLHMHV